MRAGGFSHRVAFQDIRNYLTGRFIGATRDRALLDEVVKCLFCRAWLERQGALQNLANLDSLEISKVYRKAFSEIKSALHFIFDKDVEILLDPSALAFVDKKLAAADLATFDQDPLGDAYQTFVGSEIRGAEGQFFTPAAAVAWLVEAIDPKPHESVIDPTCGAGSFLSSVARKHIAAGAKPSLVASNIYGIEKDSYLAELAAQHLALSLLEKPKIVCGDSLALQGLDGAAINKKQYINSFDVVLANPPFGTKIVSASEDLRRGFALAHRWDKDAAGEFFGSTEISTRTPPQVLFVERILTLLKPGGRAGVVLPESILSSPKYEFVVAYLRQNAEIQAVVGMPESLFKTSGKGGTHTKTCLLLFTKDGRSSRKVAAAKSSIFIAEAKWCGNDSRGLQIPRDDLPSILDKYQKQGGKKVVDRFGIWMESKEVVSNILAPRFYDPEGAALLKSLNRTHTLVKFGDLVEDGTISYTTGVEIGKLAYGTGDIPFVRTSDISNWEIKLDPKHTVSEEIFEQYAGKLDVRENDILMVKDGTYLVGNCAIVTKYDTKILYQSHLYKIRIKKNAVISPYLLLALLSTDLVIRQIKAKQLTQDIIDSLGKRIRDLILPIPKSPEARQKIEKLVRVAVTDRIEAREMSRIARSAVTDLSLLPKK